MAHKKYADEAELELEELIWHVQEGDEDEAFPGFAGRDGQLPPELVAEDLEASVSAQIIPYSLRSVFIQESDASLVYLERLAARHGFNMDAALDWLSHTEGSIPYALLKVSGSCLTDELARDIADLSHVVSLAVIVGGGDEITAECRKRGIQVQKFGPWRVTTNEVLDVVVDVMTKMANAFARRVGKYGGKAFPIVGTPKKPLMFADKLDTFPVAIDGSEVEAGYFGVIPVHKESAYLTNDLFARILNAEGDEVPVIAALGHQYARVMPEGGYQPLNIDGDMAMRLIAHKVSPEEFLFVTPSGGVTEAQLAKGRTQLVVPRLTLADFEMGREALTADEGMLQKLAEGFRIVRDYQGTRGVALVPPQHVVPYLLDRDRANGGEPNDVYGTMLSLAVEGLP